jgi:hypothetical protein
MSERPLLPAVTPDRPGRDTAVPMRSDAAGRVGDDAAVRVGGDAGGTAGKLGRWRWRAAGVLAVVALGAGAVAAVAGGDSRAGAEVAVTDRRAVGEGAAGDGAVGDGAVGEGAVGEGAVGEGAVGETAAAGLLAAARVREQAVRAAEARVEKAVAEDVAIERTGADGAFIVTVTGVRCGVKAVGAARARGRFCLVGIAVENAGQEARRLDGAAQRAVDGHGRAYAVAGRAAGVLAEQVPAGATVRGVLPFDVPVGDRLVALLVHESAGSRGARVGLS